MPRHFARSLLLIPLLAAGCATAAPPSADLPQGGSGPVRFSDVSAREVVVRLDAPAHAAILDVRPGTPSPARWLTRGTRHLEPGAHTVTLARGVPRSRSNAERACNRPGERPMYDLSLAQGVAGPADIREVSTGGMRVFCVRTETGDGERVVLVAVSPQPVSDGLLEEVMAEFNREHGSVPANAATLTRALGEMLAAEWPGSTVSHVRIPPG